MASGKSGKAGPRETSNRARVATFQPECLEDLSWWVENDPRVAEKVLTLAKECLRTPFSGRGKPEALKGALSGCLSRRITQEHRLVYTVTDDRVEFLQARYHY